MTLDPVFRSRKAVEEIKNGGYLDRMADSLEAHRRAIEYVNGLLPEVIEESFISSDRQEEKIEFLQNHFFLILFHSVFKSLGPAEERLDFYARLNLCIKGIVTAGDNIFDDEGKLLIPLKVNGGTRFASILQMLSFDRLIHRVCDQAIEAGWLDRATAGAVHRELLSRLAFIGSLEGSEEGGVGEILPPDEMLEKVHRVRGGALFSLAFIAPELIEEGETRDRFVKAEAAIRKLGTAFQIVDDLTDFEFDLKRRSHNLLMSEAYHNGGEQARSTIEKLLDGGEPSLGVVEGVLAESARTVLERARKEGRAAFADLAALGFWFPPEHADKLVHAIVGVEGVARMESLTR